MHSVHWTPIILWPRLWWFLLCIRNLNPHLRFLGISSVLPHCQEVALSKYATSLKYVWSIHFSPFLRRGPITMSKIVPVVLSTPHIMHRITKPKPKFATSRLYPERRRSLEELEINLNLNNVLYSLESPLPQSVTFQFRNFSILFWWYRYRFWKILVWEKSVGFGFVQISGFVTHCPVCFCAAGNILVFHTAGKSSRPKLASLGLTTFSR